MRKHLLAWAGVLVLGCSSSVDTIDDGSGGHGASGSTSQATSGGGGDATGSGGNHGSGGNTTTTGTTSISSGPGITCDDLQDMYAATLAEVKKCNPYIDLPQCTVQLADQLACPCPTYGEASHGEEIETLAKLQTAWQDGNCIVPCPAVECPEPQGGACSPYPDGTSGACQDYFPD